jgi:DNA-binding response OmpR family regulator
LASTRILLADPDQPLLESYQEALSRDGFIVETARDGLDCVAKLRSFGPDVLVLAPELPWGQAEGVLAMMHEEADVPLVPVMVLSVRRNLDDVRGIGVFPVSAYHVKPVSPRVLGDSLRRLLRKYPILHHPDRHVCH